MDFFDVKYRLKGDKNAEVFKKTFVAHKKEDAKLMAKAEIDKMYVIIEIKKGVNK